MDLKKTHTCLVRPLGKTAAGITAALLILSGLAFCAFAAEPRGGGAPAPGGPEGSLSAAGRAGDSLSGAGRAGDGLSASGRTGNELSGTSRGGDGLSAPGRPAGGMATGSDGGAALAASVESGSIGLDLRYGYDNTAKGGRRLPVDVTVSNSGGEDFSGTVQIMSEESDGTLYRYDHPIQVGAESETEVRYYIPLGTSARQLRVTVAGEDGTAAAERVVRLNISRDVPELFIGILSDEPDELDYLNGVGISYSTLRTRTFDLDEMDFSEDQVSLDLLDVLVVNNYKLRTLSEEQTAAIMDWVHSGGVLILGTGDRVDDTLGRFAPELLDDSYGTPGIRMINLGEDYELDEPGAGMLAISCVDIPLHGGNVILSSGGLALLTAAAKEQGVIAVAAFDMADIGVFCQDNPGYLDHLFTSLLGERRISRLAAEAYSGNSSRFWSVQTLINTGDVDKLPNLFWYTAVTGVYLGLLGPGLYLFLKRRGLQLYYRRGVFCLSLVFAGIVYLMGGSTRFRSTFYTYATILDVNDDFITDTTYLNIRSPYDRGYEVELNPEYTVLPITSGGTGGRDRDSVLTGPDAEYQVCVARREDAVVIRSQNIAPFTPRYFRLDRKSENTGQEGVVGEIDYFEGKISGSLTNQFPFPIENTTVLLYGNMVQLGRMEPGETKRLEEYELLRFPLGNSFVVAEQVSGGSRYHATDIDDKDYLLAMERSNLLKFYLDNYMTGYMADARVVAFRGAEEEDQFLKEHSPDSSGMTLLTAAMEVNASRDRSLYRSVLMKTPEVISGSYDESSNSMSGLEPLTLEYQLGMDIDVESLTFETVNALFVESGGFSELFEGNIYFYNYGTGNYDQMDLEGKTMNVDQLRPYLSPGNTLTVRYVYGGTGGYNAIQLPMPMVAGRER